MPRSLYDNLLRPTLTEGTIKFAIFRSLVFVYLGRSCLALRLLPRLTMTVNGLALFAGPRAQGTQATSHLAETISTVSMRVDFVCPANAGYAFKRPQRSLWISVILLKLRSC